MGTGKSIARAIFGALGSGAGYYGDLNKQRVQSSDDLYNALARLQMSETLDRTNPKTLLQMEVLKNQLETQKAQEGRTAGEYQRNLELENLARSATTNQATRDLDYFEANKNIKSDLLAAEEARAAQYRDLPDQVGWFDALKAASREGRMGLTDYISAPGRLIGGAIVGDTPTDTFGVPANITSEQEMAKQRLTNLLSEAAASRVPTSSVAAIRSAGGPEAYGANELGRAKLAQMFPSFGVQQRASAQQELKQRELSMKEDLKQRELDLRASDIDRKKSYGEGNLALKVQALQQSAASEQVKLAVAQTKMMTDIQKAVMLKVLDGTMTVEEADAKVPGIKDVISELMGRLSE